MLVPGKRRPPGTTRIALAVDDTRFGTKCGICCYQAILMKRIGKLDPPFVSPDEKCAPRSIAVSYTHLTLPTICSV
eukprot:3602709-Rhodomonas_salina.1